MSTTSAASIGVAEVRARRGVSRLILDAGPVRAVKRIPANDSLRPPVGDKQGPAGCGREASRDMKAGPRIGPAAGVCALPDFRETGATGRVGCGGGRSTARRAPVLANCGTQPVRGARPAFVLAQVRVLPSSGRISGARRARTGADLVAAITGDRK